MLILKGCPRCNGDVHVDRDWYGEYKNCLQCGWSQDSADDPISQLSKSVNSLTDLVAIKRAS